MQTLLTIGIIVLVFALIIVLLIPVMKKMTQVKLFRVDPKKISE